MYSVAPIVSEIVKSGRMTHTFLKLVRHVYSHSFFLLTSQLIFKNKTVIYMKFML